MICTRKFIFLILVSLAAFYAPLYGQENLKVFLHPDKFYKKYFPNLKVKRVLLDTNYIKSYPNYLTVGVHVLSPALYSTISTRNSSIGSGADVKFRTSVADIIGFSANYRFVSVGFALLLKQGLQKHADYAPSAYRTLTIKYNNPAYSFQFKYLKLKGFTEINGMGSSSLAKRPDIVNREYQFESVYNFDWKRYSYLAPLIFSQRQVKSRAGFLLKGGLYYKKFSGDSSLVEREKSQYYESFGDTKAIQNFSIKLAPGVGGNLILYKHICLSMALFTSFDVYFYRYTSSADEVSTRRESIVFALDGYVSLGYQSKRFYAGLKYETDRRDAALHGVKMNIVNAYTGLECGYRFNAPRVMKKFYKKTMPPGM
ncbi:MAG: DUF4421 family protein [Chryseolinea sp.]